MQHYSYSSFQLPSHFLPLFAGFFFGYRKYFLTPDPPDIFCASQMKVFEKASKKLILSIRGDPLRVVVFCPAKIFKHLHRLLVTALVTHMFGSKYERGSGENRRGDKR